MYVLELKSGGPMRYASASWLVRPAITRSRWPCQTGKWWPSRSLIAFIHIYIYTLYIHTYIHVVDAGGGIYLGSADGYRLHQCHRNKRLDTVRVEYSYRLHIHTYTYINMGMLLWFQAPLGAIRSWVHHYFIWIEQNFKSMHLHTYIQTYIQTNTHTYIKRKFRMHVTFTPTYAHS